MLEERFVIGTSDSICDCKTSTVRGRRERDNLDVIFLGGRWTSGVRDLRRSDGMRNFLGSMAVDGERRSKDYLNL
jgi:hypothetical protein